MGKLHPTQRPQLCFGAKFMSLRLTDHIKTFTGLGKKSSGERQDDLFRTMSTLMAASSHTCDGHQLEVYDQALLELVDMVETETRRVAAQRIAELDRAPHGIIRRLADDDEITVAGPILSKSPVLTDEDLVEICGSKSDLHLLAISERQILSAIVSEALIDNGSTAVRIQVAKNEGAQLSEACHVKLSNQSSTNYMLWNTLSKRSDLPEAVSARLVAIAKTKIKQKLVKDGRNDLAEKLDAAAQIAGKRVAQSIVQVDTDYGNAKLRLNRQIELGRLDESLVRRYALEDRFADTVVALAALVGFRHDCIVEWLSGNDLDPMLVIARANQFHVATLKALMRCGHRRTELTDEQRSEALDRYEILNEERSKELVATWRKSFQAQHS